MFLQNPCFSMISKATRYMRKWRTKNKKYQQLYAQKYYLANKEKYKKTTKQRRPHQLWSKYRLLESEYLQLVKLQRGRCGICLKKSTLNVDHDHRTGRVRMLLCTNCNLLLGLVESKIQYLDRMKQYVSHFAS